MSVAAAIVADDLTGALDAAAPFAERGLATRVACTVAGLEPALAEGPEVLAVNTATRHHGPALAAARVAEVTARLTDLGIPLLIKKVDSTLRGSLAAEVAAAVRASGRRALVCPAVPAQGRSVHAGRLLVDGRPLEETEFAPRGVAGRSLPEQLAAELGRVERISADGPWPGNGHLVADAGSDVELRVLARQIAREPRNWLVVGASGLTAALAETAFGPQRPMAPPAACGPILFVVGSRAARAREQLQRLVGATPGLRRADSDGVAAAADALVLAPDAAERDPDAVAADLSRRVRSLLGRLAPRALVLTGGDTALAVLADLGCTTLEIRGQLAPGVVLTIAYTSAGTLAVVTKAGGFGAPGLFVELLERLPRLDDGGIDA